MLNKLSDYFGKLKPEYDDDSVDRLNYIYTNIIILGFAITIAAKQYVGEPLQCWVPAQFKGGWEQYVENYCFVENTYWVPMHEELPTDHEERDEREIQYYQWVPFVLALQALCFYLPRLIWNLLNWQSGMNITALIQAAFATKKEKEKRVLKSSADVDEGVQIVAGQLKDAIDYHKDYQAGRRRIPVMSKLTKGLGLYLTLLYLFTKLLFIANVVGQFLLLNKFLGPNYTWWGVGILQDLLAGREWESSGHFPRVTMCDFEVRRLGNLQRFSVQCVLMINMFNEKIYLFLWWWFLLVAVITSLNFLYWLVICTVPQFRSDFVRRYLRVKGKLGASDPYAGNLSRFVRGVLRPDGVLILRLIADNAGDIVTANIVSVLWEKVYGGKAELSSSPTTSAPSDDVDAGFRE